MDITAIKTQGEADGADATDIQPSDWNMLRLALGDAADLTDTQTITGAWTFSVAFKFAAGSGSAPGIASADNPDVGLGYASDTIFVTINSTLHSVFGANTFTLPTASALSWSSTSNPYGSVDTTLGRQAAGRPVVMGATATPAGGSAALGLVFGSTSGFGIYIGSGAPTLSAAQGSLYLRSDGSTTATRLYVNTNGTTGWTNLVSAT